MTPYFSKWHFYLFFFFGWQERLTLYTSFTVLCCLSSHSSVALLLLPGLCSSSDHHCIFHRKQLVCWPVNGKNWVDSGEESSSVGFTERLSSLSKVSVQCPIYSFIIGSILTIDKVIDFSFLHTAALNICNIPPSIADKWTTYRQREITVNECNTDILIRSTCLLWLIRTLCASFSVTLSSLRALLLSSYFSW